MNKFKSIFKIGFVSLAGLMAPIAIYAQASNADCDTLAGSLAGVLCRIAYLVNSVIPVLIALAVAYFIWGVIKYVISQDEESKGKGRSMMIYGLIGILVIATIWGLVGLLRNSFDIDATNPQGAPQIPCIDGGGIDC